jgi:hypothetical protein
VINNGHPWLCLVEWLLWMGTASFPLFKVFVLFMCGAFLLTLDCTSMHPKSPKINCRDGFTWRLAMVGTAVVALVHLVRLAIERTAGEQDSPALQLVDPQHGSGGAKLRTMQAGSNP